MRRDGLKIRVIGQMLALVAGATLLALLSGCGSSGSQGTTTSASATKLIYHAEAQLSPPTSTPPLRLRNYLGQPVDIDQYRGKAVLITFIYTHCPDICPVITSNLRVAQNLIGPKLAAKTQIIEVSVDPRGDTRETVTRYLAQHEMTGREQYLIGTAHELARVWKAWGVGSERDAQKPEFVNHSGLIYGITASGKRATLYSATFRPADVAHDVALLAAR